jgi:hypothetical protein
MRSGGVNVVSTYVPWIHHVEHRGVPRFDDNRDVAAFVDLCHETGLEVVLRIGPWAHAEIRNGGFPDWVQAAPVTHRTDDPAYLELVTEWFGQLSSALEGRCTPAGVFAINSKRTLRSAAHLLTKRLARQAVSALQWTATAWGRRCCQPVTIATPVRGTATGSGRPGRTLASVFPGALFLLPRLG